MSRGVLIPGVDLSSISGLHTWAGPAVSLSLACKLSLAFLAHDRGRKCVYCSLRLLNRKVSQNFSDGQDEANARELEESSKRIGTQVTGFGFA